MAAAHGAAWLVLDTSTPIAVVGLWQAGVVLAEHRLTEARRHAEGLIDAVDRALLLAGVGLDEVAGVAVGRGPGSFIGVRTGIATAKGICLGRSIPLVGLPTLVALAFSVEELPNGRGMSIVDAKRGEVFAQHIEVKEGEVTPVHAPLPLTPAAAAQAALGLDFLVCAGREQLDPSGTLLPASLVIHAQASPSVAGLGRALSLRLAESDEDELSTLVPDYCRAPDAKLPAVDPGARRSLGGPLGEPSG